MTPLMKRLSLLTGAALVAASLGGAFVHAQDTSGRPGPFLGRGGPGRPFGPGGASGPGLFGPMLMRRLNLTEAQREQVKTALDSHRDEMKTVADRAFAARQALHTAIAADPFDESAVRARSADVAAVEADMAVLQGRIHSELWQLLTPEQQKEARTLQAQVEQRRTDVQNRRENRQERRNERRR